MTLVTSTEFEEHFDHDLTDDAIDRLLADAERSIIRNFGEHTSQVEWLDGLEKYVFLGRRATSITEIVETVQETDTTLSADDYSLENGLQLRRLYDGTNGRSYWGDRVKVTYVPEDDTDRRKRVQVDLVKLAIQFEGLGSSKSGNLSLNMGDYQKRRLEILSELAPTLPGFV